MFDVHDGFRNSLVGVGLAAALLAGAGCDKSKETSAPDEQAEQQAADRNEKESASPERQVDASAEAETNEEESSDEGEDFVAPEKVEASMEGPVDDQELETFVEAYRLFKEKSSEIDEAVEQASSDQEAKQIVQQKFAEFGKTVEEVGMVHKRFEIIRKRVKEGDEELRARISEIAPDLELPDEKPQPDAGRP